jgi:hypothetical protein
LDFFTFSIKVPLRFVTYLPKVQKIAKKIFGPTDRFTIGHNFLGHALYFIRIQNFFFTIGDCIGIKSRRILRRFQKHKLTFVTKCT